MKNITKRYYESFSYPSTLKSFNYKLNARDQFTIINVVTADGRGLIISHSARYINWQ